jgi:hypothetical protein
MKRSAHTTFSVMARLVRAAHRGTVLEQVARTSRAMTEKGATWKGAVYPPIIKGFAFAS